MIYDIYSCKDFLGTVEQVGDKIVTTGPDADFLLELCNDLHRPAAEVIKILLQRMRNQAMHIHEHGSSIILYDDGSVVQEEEYEQHDDDKEDGHHDRT